MSAPFLFIGGCADGRILALESPRPTVKIPDARAKREDSNSDTIIPNDTYVRRTIETAGEEFALYVHDSLTIGEALRKLIAGYPR
jgi:hypothetical protein